MRRQAILLLHAELTFSDFVMLKFQPRSKEEMASVFLGCDGKDLFNLFAVKWTKD
jgi:hypothetical protein